MRLRNSDLETALDFAGTIVDAPDMESFARRVTAGMLDLVPADVSGYTEVGADRVNALTRSAHDPYDVEVDSQDLAILARLQEENPLIVHGREHADGSAHRISELLSERDWRARELCRTFYEPREAAGDQIAISFPRPGVLIGITANLARGHFGSREQAMLDLVAPHVAGAHRAVHARERLRSRVLALEDALEFAADACVLLNERGEIDTMSRSAHALLRRLFPACRPARALPEPLAGWVDAQRRRHPLGGPHATITLELPSGRLAASLLRGSARTGYLLRLADAGGDDRASVTDRAGLTQREREVLALVAEGMTDRRIATRLSITPRTVKKHLAGSFAKLGVHTRAAAVAKLLSEEERRGPWRARGSHVPADS